MWALILFAHVGVLGSGNSNALTSVPGFENQQLCQAAGEQSKRLADGSVKIIAYTCVKLR